MDISLPGDKSISHRALMLAALAEGTSTIANLSSGVDVASTRHCLADCGIAFETVAPAVQVTGGRERFRPPGHPLDAGNSGTTARLLAGLLPGLGIGCEITGDASLSRRPMARIAEPLRQMGIGVELRNGGTLPMTLSPGRLQALDYTPPVASSQVKSAILLAALGNPEPVTVREALPTRDHTERMLSDLGVDIQSDAGAITIGAGIQKIAPFDITVPGDPSSAAFLAAQALLLKKSLSFSGLLLNPLRLGSVRVMRRMGAKISMNIEGRTLLENVGALTVAPGRLKATIMRAEEIPALIDEIPLLAILATQAEGVTIIRGARELRSKESDRIAVMVENLTAVGARVQEHDDGLTVSGPTPLHAATIRTHGDHRIAMAFAMASYIVPGGLILDDELCMDISFPGCQKLFDQVAAA
ncbi:MAG: 3-phosphoshikimate 1-carboxyvinyltransferase [Candidatus Marinimicrobia bacterium]|nr:3-phosphoshikimate 1-carboxyvinyltransferase [Candidatus Neomarinimicrobiota bacterium]